MILDSSLVTLRDGTYRQAIDLSPGRELLSLRDTRAATTAVSSRTVENRKDAIRLILSSGDTFCGSPDQRVGLFRNRNLVFVPLARVEIGSRLRGERAGIALTVEVIGKATSDSECRLVRLETRGEKPFVAEGVLCR